MSDTDTAIPTLPAAAVDRVAGKPARPVADADLFEAWQVLTGIHVGLADMGRSLDTPEQMREAVSRYFSPEMWRRIGKARRALADYVGDDEVEELESDIPYWDRQNPGSTALTGETSDQQTPPEEAE